MFDILIVFLKEFFENVNFEKNQQMTKMRGKFTRGQRVNSKIPTSLYLSKGKASSNTIRVKTIQL